jgi:hypothetical protein
VNIAAWSRAGSVALVTLLVACSGAGNSASPAAPSAANAPSSASNATATFQLEIPLAATASSTALRPKYVSAATQSVEIAVLTVNGSPPAGLAPTIANVTPTTSGCSVDSAHPGNYTCTIAAIVPAGSDVLKISLFASAGATGLLLSQQTISATISGGVANSLNAVLDASPGTITITAGPSTGIIGSQAGGFITGGTIAQTLTVHVADAAGDPIGSTLPGAPVLSAISSLPGVASVTVNSAAGTLSVVPGTTFGTTSITVSANPLTSTSALTPSTRTFTVTNDPLIAAGGCSASCSATVFTYGGASPVFTAYGALPSASFGGKVISALGFDGSDTLYAAAESDNASEGFLEFANAAVDQPLPVTAPPATGTVSDTNDLDGVAGFDITREGTLAVANALGDAGNSNVDQLTAYPAGSSARVLGKSFGSTISGESVAAMPSASGTIQGYATALFDSSSGAGSVGVVIPGGSGSTCDTAASPSVPCGLITLGAANGISADGAFDLVWDRADQALIVANYNVTTSTYNLVQLNWTGSSFAAPMTLPSPATANGAVFSNNGPSLSVSRDGHVAAVFPTSGSNYDVRIYAPGTTLAARSSVDITSVSQTLGIDAVELLPDDSPLILTAATSNNICVYNLTTQAPVACTTLSNAIDTAVSGAAVHRVINASPEGVGRRSLWKNRYL